MQTTPLLAGEVRRSRARSTRTLIILIDTTAPGGEWIDGGDGRWVTLCDEHGGLICHDYKTDAIGWMSAPEQWCPVCSGEQEL